MRRKTFAAAALLLWTSSTMAQDLSVTKSPPISGDLLIQAGTFRAERWYVDSGHCPPDDETRQQTEVVFFNPPYQEAPQVLVSLNELDFDVHDETPRNPRITARAESVSRGAMILVVETWCDTNLARAGGTYLAIGRSGSVQDDETLAPAPAPAASEPPRVVRPLREPAFDWLDNW